MVENTIHEAADGKRYLVIHGDFFDVVVRNARWLAHLGDWAYEPRSSESPRQPRPAQLGLPYWSLSAWAKLKVKNAVNFIGDFEQTLPPRRGVRRRRRDLRPHPPRRDARHDGIRYINCGDWVESCTAIVEHYDGRLELIPGPIRCAGVAPVAAVAARAA